MEEARPLPTGTVTFLFTDIEGSTRLWEQHPQAMHAALARHHTLIADAIQERGGAVVKSQGEGDSVFAVFARASDAVAAACALQKALVAEPWPAETTLRVRVALHTGEADLREGDYYGSAVNRCARLRAAGHGGQVLLSQATRDMAHDSLPAEAGLRDLGLHRPRDLQQPDRIFQLLHPALPGEFPPLRSLDVLPNNLPAQLSSFVGREKEMAEVKQLLSATRLLTLTGTGGCGKTRLALQVAAEVLEEYPDGVWLAELAALADPAVVPRTVASGLRVREEPDRPLTQTLADYLRPKSLLLILDNCEHLLTACAQLVETLLRACPQLRILASSREGLGIVGEQSYRVPSLPVPDPRHLPPLERLREFEAVRLFADRAALSQSTFAVTEGNAPVVAQVCHRLDGIPLAIELAAVRVKALPVEQMAARLDDRFRLLTGGSRTALPRQQTLRAAIDWSYELLSEAERMLLRRLSVLTWGFPLEVAEAVCAQDGIEDWEVLDLLTRLVDKSLVVYDEHQGEARYRLLESIRQYAWEHLRAAGETFALRNRHRDWYLKFAERAEPELQGPDQGKWLDRLEQENEHLRAALGWTMEAGDGEAGLRLGAALWRFWWARGYWSEGRERLMELLATTEASKRTAVRARALHGAGVLAQNQADYVAARALFEDSLAIGRELDSKPDILRSLHSLGNVAFLQGDYGAARELYEESLAIARELGDKLGIAGALHTLGNVASFQCDFGALRTFTEESLALFRELGQKQGLAGSLHPLGNLAWAEGNPAAAHACLEESLAIFRELGNKPGIAGCLYCLGEVEQYRGRYDTAHARYEESLILRRELGDKRGIAISLSGLGNVAQDQGNYGTAQALFEESLTIGRRMDNRLIIALSLNYLGRAVRRQGDSKAARSLHEQSLAICREDKNKNKIGIAMALDSLGDVALEEGHYAEARSSYEERLSIWRALGCKIFIAVPLEGLARLADAKGRPERAVRLFGAAEALREAIGAPLPPVDRPGHEREVADIHAALGEDAFVAAWSEGRAMTLEDAIAFALDEAPKG